MKTWYFPGGIRVHWQKCTKYRPCFGVVDYPHCKTIFLWRLVLEKEDYPCAMTRRSVVTRNKNALAVI